MSPRGMPAVNGFPPGAAIDEVYAGLLAGA
jgi:hypothetical protein